MSSLGAALDTRPHGWGASPRWARFPRNRRAAFCAEVEERDRARKTERAPQGRTYGLGSGRRSAPKLPRQLLAAERGPGGMRPGGPLFLRGQRGLRVPAGELMRAAAPGGSRPGRQGAPGVGARQRAGLAASWRPRQVQHHRVSPGDHHVRHGHLDRLHTERELGRTGCLPLHLWLAPGNLLWLQQRQRLWKELTTI